MKFEVVQDNRIGARPYNQDRLGHWSTRESLLLVLADGMGGHLHGEIAAQLAVEYMGTAFQREAKPRLANPALFLFQVIGRTHAAILQQARERELPESPRTTVVACVVQDGYAYWSHIGDSRLYLLRKGRIVARTRDHTRVQQLVDTGRIREEAVASHPERNKLLQCLGGYQPPKIERTSTERLQKDDIVLLCSDGFWGPLTQRQMLVSFTDRPLPRAVSELSTLAEARAGNQADNISALAITWGEEEVADNQQPVHTIPQFDLPTDVQDFSATDPDFLRMSDADIEKAIAEIKEALKKNPSANQ